MAVKIGFVGTGGIANSHLGGLANQYRQLTRLS